MLSIRYGITKMFTSHDEFLLPSYFIIYAHALSTVLSIGALQALKRKKRYEKQLAQIDGTLSTIEFQREALENANTSTEVLKNMGFAAKALKAAHKDL